MALSDGWTGSRDGRARMIAMAVRQGPGVRITARERGAVSAPDESGARRVSGSSGCVDTGRGVASITPPSHVGNAGPDVGRVFAHTVARCTRYCFARALTLMPTARAVRRASTFLSVRGVRGRLLGSATAQINGSSTPSSDLTAPRFPRFHAETSGRLR